MLDLSPFRIPLVALVGSAGSGKDTLARELVNRVSIASSGAGEALIVALADPFKRFLLRHTPATRGHLWGPSYARQVPVPGMHRHSEVLEELPQGEVSCRDMLQFFDGMRAFDKDIWVKEALDTLRQLDRSPTSRTYFQDIGLYDRTPPARRTALLIVPDVRQVNEACALHKAGAKLLRVVGKGALADQETTSWRQHVSEKDSERIPQEWFTGTVEVNLSPGMFPEVLTTASKLYQELLAERVREGMKVGE